MNSFLLILFESYIRNDKKFFGISRRVNRYRKKS